MLPYLGLDEITIGLLHLQLYVVTGQNKDTVTQNAMQK